MIDNSDDDDDENLSDNDEVPELVTPENTNYTKDDLSEYRQQLENEISFSEVKSTNKADDSIRKYIESCTQYLGNIKMGPEVEIPAVEISVQQPEKQTQDTIQPQTQTTKITTESIKAENTETETIRNATPTDNEDAHSISSNDLETDDVGELANMDPNSRMYRLKMVQKLLNDARSQRSYSTTASTIAPSVVTDRIKKNMDKKERVDMRKRCVAKGEASAVHRHRKDNKDVVKEYAGWDF